MTSRPLTPIQAATIAQRERWDKVFSGIIGALVVILVAAAFIHHISNLPN